MTTRTVVRQDRQASAELATGRRPKRHDEFAVWYTQERMLWLRAVASCPSASGLAIRCAIIMAEGYVNGEHAAATRELLAWPSQERLAEATQSTRDGVKKALEKLSAAGLLVTRPGRGRGVNTRYLLTRPRGEKTQTAVEVFGSDNPDLRQAFQRKKTQTAVDRKPRLVSEKTPTGVCTNPVKEPCEYTPQVELAVERILKALPFATLERSNRAAVRTAVAGVVAQGTEPKRLALAVEAFCEEADTAKTERGRYMGAAHKWLVEKRGWEAHLPSEDAVFLDGRAEGDRPWLYRVRSWQTNGRWDRYDNGPPPGEAGCQIPAEVLAHCDENPRPGAAARSAGRKAVGFV